MGEYFQEKPKNKYEELEHQIYLINKKIDEMEEKLIPFEELEELKKSIREIRYNLANHEHKDGKTVIINELNEFWEEEY